MLRESKRKDNKFIVFEKLSKNRRIEIEIEIKPWDYLQT